MSSSTLPSVSAAINGTQTEANLQWNDVVGALEYELEWTWVDGYLANSLTGIRSDNDILFSDRDFELNNTRIITTKKNFQIPLIYSKGYLIYRVRAVGRHPFSENSKVYGNWSSGTNPKTFVSDWTKITIANEHENGKNWQFQASYAENGKKKEVVSYFDGSLRNRQTVTKVNTDNTTVVGEVIYDHQGRAAIEVLPTPTIDQNIHFFNNFNLNQNNNPFSYKDFDYEPLNATCNTEIPVSPMSNVSGSSRYYSTQGLSDFSGRLNQKYVPDAKLFPFSQTEYTNDNTGRIARKGGVGSVHQLGSNHEMKYIYSSLDNSKELNRLFGYSVGNVTHYKKNTVVDPNGQISVSYIDPQGRTIATALTGGVPPGDKIIGLEDEVSSNHGIISADLLNNSHPQHFDQPDDFNILGTTGNFPLNDDKLVVAKPITVAGINVPHTFTYSMSHPGVFAPENCTATYPFVYDLKLSFKDNCGLDVAGFAPIQETAINSFSERLIPASPASLSLNTGTYNLFKELKVNKDALIGFADDYIKKLSTLGSPLL